MADMPNLEFGDTLAAPELEMVTTTKQEVAVAPPQELDQLSPEEKKAIEDFLPKINLMDSQGMLQYGMPAQTKIAAFSDDVLRNVRTKDMGEVGKALTDLVLEIKNFDTEADNSTGIKGWFRGAKQKVDKLTVRYSKVEINIEQIVQTLEGHKKLLLKDIKLFDAMYDNNLQYLKELTMYYLAGREKLRVVNETVLPELRAKADAGDAVDAQKLNDMLSAINRFEKKLHDLQLSRTVSLQMGPQIRLMQNNDSELVDKIQSSIVNAIPLWKNQMVIALGLNNARMALEAQRSVTDMTNELLKKNAEMLKMGTIEVAKEGERGIVDLETVRKVNADLIETINEVYRIQEEGRTKRAEAEVQIQSIEQELRTALMQQPNNRQQPRR